MRSSVISLVDDTPSSTPPPRASSTPLSPDIEPPTESLATPIPISNSAEQSSSISQNVHAAAVHIQRAWRRHTSLRKLYDLSTRFQTLAASFVPPATLDYTLADARTSEDGTEHLTAIPTEGVPYPPSISSSDSPTPRLAYTTHTRPVHAQNEAYVRLLNALDAVPSWGDRAVRDARRRLAHNIESEAASLESWWRAVWRVNGTKE